MGRGAAPKPIDPLRLCTRMTQRSGSKDDGYRFTPPILQGRERRRARCRMGRGVRRRTPSPEFCFWDHVVVNVIVVNVRIPRKTMGVAALHPSYEERGDIVTGVG